MSEPFPSPKKSRHEIRSDRHEPSVAMGSLSDVLAEAGLDVQQFDLFESVPETLPWSEAAGLIVLGGTMSANDGDRFPFLVAELDWIRTAVRRQVPLLGICLGAQLWPRLWGPPSIATPSRKLAGIRSNSCPPRRKIDCFEAARAGRRSFIGTATPSICRPAPSTWHAAPCAGIRPFVTVRWLMACNSTSRWCPT